MNSMENQPDCIVSGGGKLPAEVGPDAICAAIRSAIADQVSRAPVSVQVTVNSPYALTAKIVVAGASLPDEHLSISDRSLTRSAVDRFAKRIAEVAANAG